MERGDSNDVFRRWSEEYISSRTKSPIIGAWKRPLFAGKLECTTEDDEEVYNVQTSTLFVDLRIPRCKPVRRWENAGKQLAMNGATSRQILESFSNHDLRLYARQHVFGGFSALSLENGRSLCTRHHCIDWNYIPGKPRPRPNKWYIERCAKPDNSPFDVWNEWSYATDENGQCYYYERWERLPRDEVGCGFRLALRKRKNRADYASINEDGILVAVGDHFNYIIGRELRGVVRAYPNASNLVELVDSAIANGDRETAITCLSLDGGHGTISSGWVIDCAIQPWKHGKQLVNCINTGKDTTEIKVVGHRSDLRSWDVVMGSHVWDVYECSLSDATDLEASLRNMTSITPGSRL